MKRVLAACLSLLLFQSAMLFAADAKKVIDAHGRPGGLFVVIGCGDKGAPQLAVDLAKGGNALVQAVASTPKELAAFQKAIADANVKGLVSAEQVDLKELIYRDNLVNVMVIMDPAKAAAAGFSRDKAMKYVAPTGKLITPKGGDWDITAKPMPKNMDTWTHHRHGADGNPTSSDKVVDLPLGYRWNAGLPMNFSNPVRASNRYSAARGIALTKGRCLILTESTVENLGPNYRTKYGTDQYLTCRDAFNGLMLWRKKIGGTFYGGLYIENRAPFCSDDDYVYVAGENDKLLVIDLVTGKTVKELDTKYIPGVILNTGGVVVTATWKDGKILGPIKNYDRRRMDWDIGEGSIEAYDQKTLKQLWKNDLLGTSMRLADGKVFIVSRSEPDALEKAHNRRLPKPKKGKDGKEIPIDKDIKPLTHPAQRVIAMDLKTGKVLWSVTDEEIGLKDKALRVVIAANNRVIVGGGGVSGTGVLLAANDGKKLCDLPRGLPVVMDGKVHYGGGGAYDLQTGKKQKGRALKESRHICTPLTYVNDITVANRGGSLVKDNKHVLYGGVRGGCLTGSLPAYGSLFTPQNWCRCSPGQIAGFISVGPIGHMLTAQEMEQTPIAMTATKSAPTSPMESYFGTARGNAERSSSANVNIPAQEPKVSWQKTLTEPNKTGLTTRDWRSFLNNRITPAATAGNLAIVCDTDQNEVIAVDRNSGDIVWRYQTAGRSSVAPTLYKGLCLVADYCGYVYALDMKSGALVYRLRIAPQEIRMLSYGKVESVWPIVGGVMIVGDKAYVSAGRSQGSDGGIIIRAFNPETGQVIWSKALVQGKNNRANRINDMLAKQGDALQLMEYRFDLASAKEEPNPNAAYGGVKHQAQRNRDPKKRAEFQEKLKTMPTDICISMAVEGFGGWFWSRVGDRKFGLIGYGSCKGHCVAWNDKYASTARGNAVDLVDKAQVTHQNGPKPKALWGAKLPNGTLITSVVLCNNALLAGGSVPKGDKETGVVQAIDYKTGKPLWTKEFDKGLAFNGISVAPDQVLVSLEDGTLASLK